jgi:ubiquinone/menaquinone biosynthesis C-methylase UbiE
MDEPPAKRKRLLYRAFHDTDAYLQDSFVAYSDIYQAVPRIEYEEALVDRHSFDYCLERKYFVLVLPYTKHREILLERSLAGNQLRWALLGGSVWKDMHETFVDAANRHASKAITNIELGEIEPIAFLKNTFTYHGLTHEHYGVALAGRIRNLDPAADLRKTRASRAHLIPSDDETIEFDMANNTEVVRLMRQYVRELDLSTAPEFEVSENEKYKHRYAIHGLIVKRLFAYAGRYHFRHSLQDLSQITLRVIQSGPHKKILDVACGDNTSIGEFAQLPAAELVVGNDVSWSQIQLIHERIASDRLRNAGAFVMFTNHDARRLPIPDNYFDIILCKNVLHHMDDLKSVEQLVREMLRVSKRVLIIEIMDPQYESLWGRFRHQYYMRYLHDAGRNFLSPLEFTTLMDIPETKKKFNLETIRGVYQFALLGNS